MEQLPKLPGLETDDEKSEDSRSSKKKKRAEALGAFLVDPKKSEEKNKSKENEKDSGSLWESLGVANQKEVADDGKTAKPKAERADDKETPIDTLSETERQEASEHIVEALQSADQERGEEPTEALEQEAEEAVEHFRSRVTEEHESVEEAYEATVAEIEENTEALDGENMAGETEEVASGSAETEAEALQEFGEEPIELNSQPAENDAEAEDDNPAVTATSTSAARTTTTTVTPAPTPSAGQGAGSGGGRSRGGGGVGAGAGGAGGGSAGGAGMPPLGGGAPFANRYGGPNAYPYAVPGTFGSPNTPPVPPTVVTRTRTERVPYYNESDITGAALVGGIIGYLIGRRRGRIKTEKKLLPVQKKLEKQVTALREDIIAKEESLRKTVYEKRSVERQLADRPREIVPGTTRLVETRAAAPEASRLHVAPVPPERIGRVLVAAEAPRPRPAAERPMAEKPATREQKVDAIKAEAVKREVATMRREDLLEVSETIVVAGSTLRQIYETHLLGEKGLRRLVTEHLQGKDIRKLLRQELIERQIDFERDPMLRDRTHDNGGGSAAKSSGPSSVSQLLQKVNSESDKADQERIVQLQKQAEHEAAVTARQAQQRRTADLTMGVVISILLVLVIILAATHH